MKAWCGFIFLSAINSDLAITGEEGKDFKLTVRED